MVVGRILRQEAQPNPGNLTSGAHYLIARLGGFTNAHRSDAHHVRRGWGLARGR